MMAKSKKILLAQLFLYCFIYLSFNNKTFFPPILIYIFYLFYLLKDFKQALWLTLLAVLPLSWGLRHLSLEVPLPYSFTILIQRSFILYFPITAFFLILVFLFLILSFSKYRLRKIPIEKQDISILLFVFCLGMSFIRSPYLFLGLFGFWNYLQLILVYFLTRFFTQNKDLRKLSLNSLFVLVIFQGLWASFQFVLQRPLGRLVEIEQATHTFGIYAYEDPFQFRSSGTLSHPNILVVFLGLLFPLILSQAIAQRPYFKNKILIYSALITSVLAITFTMSRWGWLVIFLINLLMTFIFYKKGKMRKIFLDKRLRVGFLILMIVFTPIVFRRVITFNSAFEGDYSSWQSRKELMQESLMMIKNELFLGVGPGHFLVSLAQNRNTDVSYYFFALVHNFFLLVASELGLPALICFIFFITFFIQKSFLVLRSKKQKDLWSLQMGQLMSVFSFLFFALFYTGPDISLALFFIILGINLS